MLAIKRNTQTNKKELIIVLLIVIQQQQQQQQNKNTVVEQVEKVWQQIDRIVSFRIVRI
jgi:hypothetical protein